jgi:hypothetical protein
MQCALLNSVICAMAQLTGGAPVKLSHIVKEVRSYNGTENIKRRDILLVLEVLRDVGEARCHPDRRWQLCPIEDSVFDYSDGDAIGEPRNRAWLDDKLN